MNFLLTLLLTITNLQNDVAIIPINGSIDKITQKSIERRINQAIKDKFDTIVFDMNTPGGDLQATLEICHFLKTKNSLKTIAFINPNAYSAGAIIALACDAIDMAKNASFGDAAPISGLMIPLPPTERAKIEAPVLTEVIDSARLKGWDENLVQSLISVEVELWLIENKKNKKRIAVDRIEYKQIFGEEPPTELTPLFNTNETEIETEKSSGIFDAFFKKNTSKKEKTKESTDNKISRKRFTEEDKKNWTLIKQIVSNDRLLTVKPTEAMEIGFTKNQAFDSIEDLLTNIKSTKEKTYHLTWSEYFAKFLNSGPVRLILIVLLVAGVFLEAVTGTAIFFSIAVACFGLIVWGPLVAGLSSWWPVFLSSAGLILVLVEVLFLPGGGFLGLLGGVGLVIGLGGFFITPGETGGLAAYELVLGSSYVVFSVILGLCVSYILARFLKLKGNSNFILNTSLNTKREKELIEVGTKAITVTDLKPSGKIEYKDKEYYAITEGSFLEKGTEVEIIKLGTQIKVKKNDPPHSSK